MKRKKPECYVLLADDTRDDLLLLARALKDVTHFRIAYLAKDGSEAIRYLEGQGPFADRAAYPFPHLLILDLKMPCVDGFTVLRWIQNHRLAPFVIVAVTGSDDPVDVEQARALGVDAIFNKPIGMNEIRDMVGRVEQLMLTAPRNITC